VGALRARLASRNIHKLAELQHALPDWHLSTLVADDYPREDGTTYLDNARAKARFGRPLAPPEEWVLGEDSGIEVEALGGRPGVETARWAGHEHVPRLLAALAGVRDRTARYVCELVALDPEGRELRGHGVLEGSIAVEARGDEGFGFDPIFIPKGEMTTVAFLGNEWKAQNSHRARAARALSAQVESVSADRGGC
jgi:XTP/dITP diphosphohydrolase